MAIQIKRTIFNNTLFQGLPVNLRWQEEQPKNIYQVSENRIYMICYKSWHDINCFNDIPCLRRMFIHDICHMFLYYVRGDHYRLHQTDFGLTWDNVERVNGYTIVGNIDEYEDELRIVTFSHIFDNLTKTNQLMSYGDYLKVMRSLEYFQYKSKYSFTSKTYMNHRKKMISNAYKLWERYTIDQLREFASNLGCYLSNYYD